MKTDVQNSGMQEMAMKTINGFLALGIWIVLAAGDIVAPFLWGLGGFIISVCLGILLIVALPGFAIIRPNEAIVLTLFGKYVGTVKGEGFYWYNPFCVPVRHVGRRGKMSLKAMTLDNGQQKINDELGNPIIIGIVVIWRVTNTAKAAFDVDDYEAYLSTQCDSALRSIVRQYPYDGFNNDAEKSLQGSSLEVAERLQEEIQSKVEMAGLEILEARITHLAYAPEIASAMLQRQQAAAIIGACL